MGARPGLATSVREDTDEIDATALVLREGMTKYHCTITIWEEEGVFVATCAELEVPSCRDTPQEALLNIREAISLYRENAKALGIQPEIEELVSSPTRITSTIEVEA